MHKSLEVLCVSLNTLSKAVTDAWTDDRTLCEVYGYHHPAITRHDLASLPNKIASRIKDASPVNIDEALEAQLKDVPRRLQVVQSTVVPYMFNGHGYQAIPAYYATLDWLVKVIEPVVGWQVLNDTKAMPASLARRLRSIQASLTEIVPEKNALKNQIQLIQDATEAAESLPIDLQNLKEARKKVESFRDESAEYHGKIDTYLKKAEETTNNIINKEKEADKLVQQCEEAYKITTTKGLAAAFDQRATRLSNSMWVWVIGLLVALVVGAIIGYHRIEMLSTTLNTKDSQWNIIILQSVLSILSVGAPLWFSWLSTKQISQRFRLAEDYAFKASVAKAYEGYRSEAAKIDKAFEARLFASALTRLEEAPLRLVEHDIYSSPWQEFMSSKAFQNALATIPELKENFISFAKQGLTRNKEPQIISTPQTLTNTEDLPIN